MICCFNILQLNTFLKELVQQEYLFSFLFLSQIVHFISLPHYIVILATTDVFQCVYLSDELIMRYAFYFSC